MNRDFILGIVIAIVVFIFIAIIIIYLSGSFIDNYIDEVITEFLVDSTSQFEPGTVSYAIYVCSLKFGGVN